MLKDPISKITQQLNNLDKQSLDAAKILRQKQQQVIKMAIAKLDPKKAVEVDKLLKLQ